MCAKTIGRGVAFPPWPYSPESAITNDVWNLIAGATQQTQHIVHDVHNALGTLTGKERSTPHRHHQGSSKRHAGPRRRHRKGGFLGTAWDVNDLLVVIASFACYAIGTMSDSSGTIVGMRRTANAEKALRWLNVARAGRPFRLIQYIPSIADMISSLLASLRVLGTYMCLFGLALAAYAIVGMELFKGLFWHCEFDSSCVDGSCDDTGSYSNSYMMASKLPPETHRSLCGSSMYPGR